MARTTAPLLSFDASGAIAKTQVYSTWKGRPYARRYVIPSNPNTTAQQTTRNVFKWLNAVFPFLPADVAAAWELQATSLRFTGRNGFVHANLSNMKASVDLSTFLMSPSAAGGFVAAGMTLTPGATQITAALTAPGLPTGWTITAAFAAAIADQDPHTGTKYTVTSATDATAPYSCVITGLTTAQLYFVGGFFKFTKPDGSVAYGASLMDSATPT